MKRWHLAGAVVSACLFVTTRAAAQRPDTSEVLTLGDAVDIASLNNLGIQNAQLSVTRAGQSLSAAKTQRWPTLSLDGFSTYTFTPQSYTIPGGAFGDLPVVGPIPPRDTTILAIDGPWASIGVNFSQPILQQFRIGKVIDQHELQEQISEQGLRGQQLEVVKNVRQQYYEILKTESALQAAGASVTFYRELVRLVSQYVDQGVAPEYELLQTQARLARAEHTARTEANTLKTQKERFNNLLGRDPKTAFRTLPESGPGAVGYPSMAAAEAIAVAQRPDVQEKVLRLQQAEASRSMIKTEYIPSLNFVARYTRMINVDFLPPEDASIGVHLRWDIFDWGRKRHDIKGKDADIAQAMNDIRDAEAQAAIEVDARYRDLEQAEELVKVTAIEQTAAAEKLRVLTNQYRQEAALLKDVLQAESELSQANSQHRDAILSVATAQAQLDHAMGQS